MANFYIAPYDPSSGPSQSWLLANAPIIVKDQYANYGAYTQYQNLDVYVAMFDNSGKDNFIICAKQSAAIRLMAATGYPGYWISVFTSTTYNNFQYGTFDGGDRTMSALVPKFDSLNDALVYFDALINTPSVDVANLSGIFVGSTEIQKVILNGSVIYAKGAKATVSGLGSEDPSDVQFTVDNDFPTSFDEWTDGNGNVFVKIPTMYRKINTVENGQITSFTMATSKLDNDYEPYPVFIDVNDNNRVLDFVYVGKYCYNSNSSASSSTSGSASLEIGNARKYAKAVGYGYQQYDVHFHKLLQDLFLLISKDVNFNNGSAALTEYAGIYNIDNGVWVDGVGNSLNGWLISNDPESYRDNPSISDYSYYITNYALTNGGSAGKLITSLGYDPAHPFINLPNDCVSSPYNTYYCDSIYGPTSGSLTWAVRYYFGGQDSEHGIWNLVGNISWGGIHSARLCYRPVHPKLETPSHVSVTGTDASFVPVANGEEYEFFVDGNSIGTFVPV